MNNRLRNYSLFIIHYSLFAIFLAGCGHSSRPADLPKLFPCTVTVTQDGKPLGEAVVKFIAQTEDGAKYKPVAVTGADGKIAMATYGFPGVPAGKYKIVIIKNIDGDIVYKTDDAGEKVIVSYKTYRTVEKQFSAAETTPYEIEISSQSKNIDVMCDVGKAVKQKI